MLSPSTSVTISLACRLRREPAQLGRTYTTTIFEDLLAGICSCLPHASAAGEALHVSVSHFEALPPAYAYWIRAVSSLESVTDLHIDDQQAVEHLLDFTHARLASRLDVPFPSLRRLNGLDVGQDIMQELERLL